MDYINPFGAMAPVSGETASPFLRDMDRGTRNNMAIPFVEMARKAQELEMQKKQFDLNEHTSPLAQQARETGLQKQVVSNQSDVRSLPWKTDAEITKAKQEIELSPYITEQKKAEAEQAAIKARGTPAAAFFNEVAGINQAVKNLPEGARPLAAQQYIEQFKARHPGAKIPAFMEKYDPTSWDLASLVAINTAQHQQKLAEQEQKDKAHMEREREQTRRSVEVANIGANSRQQIAENRSSDKPLNPGQELVRLNAIIRDPNTSPEEKEQARLMLKAQPVVQDKVIKSIEARALEIARKKVTADQIRDEVYREFGITDGAPQKKQEAGAGIAERVRASGIPYEPNKFEYRIGPNGQIQRKAK